ncbi:MAG: nitrate reductase associated protein [Oscillatoriales cyanobacterium CG2_30_40_61]|nr:MAG: nitrate reductase associated protein [Oscillatoriales cyanobacterium CG2_30_40_61]
MNNLFEFEQDFVESLRCIPMIMRYKLDSCGVKLKLEHWNKFSQEDRQQLVNNSINTPEEITAYRNLLYELAEQYTNIPLKDLPIDEQPLWLEIKKIPDTVQQKAEEIGVNVTLKQWQDLSPLQRFALLKLSRPSHENKNFLPALREFKILENGL